MSADVVVDLLCNGIFFERDRKYMNILDVSMTHVGGAILDRHCTTQVTPQREREEEEVGTVLTVTHGLTHSFTTTDSAHYSLYPSITLNIHHSLTHPLHSLINSLTHHSLTHSPLTLSLFRDP